MTIDTERSTFRGVVCLHCKAAIPVPAIVDNTQDFENGSDSKKSQVFNVRCPACHKEKPYRTREIVDFEGTPELTPRPEPSGPVRWFPGLTKAAKA